ncbi:MAG TPA: phosphatase PAP2-related protein, partial [Candidatus Paceibacterota bacterium]|nr:phosphatase PAP2-related protein [Candidatus Paceibacterota bacterium]
MASEKPLPLYKHPRPHKEVLRRHHKHWVEDQRLLESLISMCAFAISYFIIFPYSINFANTHAGTSVPDIVLSNIPVFNVVDFFVYGMFALITFIAAICFLDPKKFPFILNSLSIFVLIRSVFVSLTHLGPFETRAASDFGPAINKAFFGADFFFSGHTGAPFLMALIFWQDKVLRYIFLTWSVFFGIIVLLGHLHYSIDVLSAFFITY